MIKEDKCLYDKKFVYLDYMERGKKMKNGGFFKWEVKGDICRVMIHIRGLYPTDTLQGELQIISQGISYPADQVTLHFGSGEYFAVWNANGLAGTDVNVESCDGLRIRLSENRILNGLWRESDKIVDSTKDQQLSIQKEVSNGQEATQTEEPIQRQSSRVEGPMQEQPVEKEEAIWQEKKDIKREPVWQEKQVLKEEPIWSEQDTLKRVNELEEQDIKKGEQEPQVTENVPQSNESSEESVVDKAISLSGDKWQQLKKQFMAVTPFQDGREYLSITPRDFTVLPGKYQTLVQNSFLLHGYYNYGHVVLVREKDRLEEKYYLGVPGVYYEREKQAALMFGFEGFEGGNVKNKDGGFGYYMKRVEI